MVIFYNFSKGGRYLIVSEVLSWKGFWKVLTLNINKLGNSIINRKIIKASSSFTLIDQNVTYKQYSDSTRTVILSYTLDKGCYAVSVANTTNRGVPVHSTCVISGTNVQGITQVCNLAYCIDASNFRAGGMSEWIFRVTSKSNVTFTCDVDYTGDKNWYANYFCLIGVGNTTIPEIKGKLTYKDFIAYPSRGTKSVTFDIKSIPNWDQLTVDNVAILYAGLNPITDTSTGSLSRSYSNGVVTVSIGGTIGFDTPGTGTGVAIRVFYVEF